MAGKRLQASGIDKWDLARPCARPIPAGSCPGTGRRGSGRHPPTSPPPGLITRLSYLQRFLGTPNWHLTECLPHVGQYQLAYLLNACICWRQLSNYLTSASGRGPAKGAAAEKQLLQVVCVQTLRGTKPCRGLQSPGSSRL